MRLSLTTRRAAVLATLLIAAACSPSGEQPDAAPRTSVGHVFRDSVSGILIDLPANWRGRYRVVEGVAGRLPGLQREVALNFVRADSTPGADSPMLVAMVFERDAWRRIVDDSASGPLGGQLSGDETRALVLRRATGNPFAQGTADALAYDSLMIALYRRPLRTALRPAADSVSGLSGPDAPGASSP